MGNHSNRDANCVTLRVDHVCKDLVGYAVDLGVGD